MLQLRVLANRERTGAGGFRWEVWLGIGICLVPLTHGSFKLCNVYEKIASSAKRNVLNVSRDNSMKDPELSTYSPEPTHMNSNPISKATKLNMCRRGGFTLENYSGKKILVVAQRFLDNN